MYRRNGLRFPTRQATNEQIRRRGERYPGFEVVERTPNRQRLLAQYGPSRVLVHQYVRSLGINSGYLPHLPSPYAVTISGRPPSVRVGSDLSLEVGVMQRRAMAQVLSELPPITEYGSTKSSPPLSRKVQLNTAAVLPPRERQLNLDLPSALPPRVRQYAREIVKTASPDESNYRRAQRLAIAVQNAATYTLRPPAVPENRDAVDYFLFSSRRGYCTYFASALTVLCRTQGIPARVVSGFTNTEWIRDSDGMVSGMIREANAHAWTEVWVDGWGWATLDATPADDRGDNAPSIWNGMADWASTRWGALVAWVSGRWHLLVLGAFIVANGVLLFVARGGWAALTNWRMRWRMRRSGRGPLHDDDRARNEIFEAYRLASRTLAQHFRRRAPWETPTEWLQNAESVVLVGDWQPLRSLTDLYLRAKYDLQPLSSTDREAARSALSKLTTSHQWKKTSEGKA
jgi:transglutaminase-like putative cysteine protease